MAHPATASPDATASGDFLDVTEVAGEPISSEQLERLCHRYFWAREYCRNRDAVELACGTGPGLGILAQAARSFDAGDFSGQMVERVRRHYGNRIRVQQFAAQDMPYPDRSRDLILIFEALYYLPDVAAFFRECRRVLRPGGQLLIATANKDLADFNPSPHSHRYLGAGELHQELAREGFRVRCFGHLDVGTLSPRQKILRPIKKLAVASGLMPKTMRGKQLLKRLVFGQPVPMPAELTENMQPADIAGTLTPLPPGAADQRHKVIYCEATLPA
ncbi:MAG: class I SAM-dependent methyltransferase [Gammaproteobacteria bacterium]|nr:MAG: class I SAM-dependent methyltransferase [Gammaproteobacteria bacterium]